MSVDNSWTTLAAENLDKLVNMDQLMNDLTKLKGQIDLENAQFQNDKTAFSVQRVLLASLLAVYPKAIRTYIDKPGQGAMYALTNLNQQISELFDKINSFQSLEAQVEYITNNVLEPLLKDLITGLFDSVYNIKQEVKVDSDFVDDKQGIDRVYKYLDKVLKSFAPLVDQKGQEAEQKLTDYLTEV